jgi:hypothetical protein
MRLPVLPDTLAAVAMQLTLPGLERVCSAGPRTVLQVDVHRFVVSVELRRAPGVQGPAGCRRRAPRLGAVGAWSPAQLRGH